MRYVHPRITRRLLFVSTTVLGVRIDTFSHTEVKERLRAFLLSKESHIVVTPNPEILVAASKDRRYRAILNAADLTVCDGKGIELFAKKKVHRFPGVDLLVELLETIAKEQKKVFFLGTGSEATLTKAEETLRKKIPTLQVAGHHPGISYTYRMQDGVGDIVPEDKKKEETIIDTIIAEAPDVLVVAFGHPKQEIWLSQHIAEFPSVRIAIGVGGSLDTIADVTPRAPLWMRRAGLEWLWRLCLQPKRIKRILTAVLVFPYYIFLERIGVRSSSA